MSTLLRNDDGIVLMACLTPKAIAATSLDVREGIVLRDVISIKSSFSSLPDDIDDCCDALSTVVVASADDVDA
jgi:hypothetical protein